MHSKLLTTLSLCLSTASALALPVADAEPQATYNNGLWTSSAPYQTYGAGSPQGGYTQITTAPGPVITSSAVYAPPPAGTQSVSAWEYTVTWPAGCETWANPCPSGAHISGGGVAGGATLPPSSGVYTNGFTSYTTMTNSEGVITGMPSKATVPAGVSTSNATTTTTGAPSSAAAASTTMQTGFSVASASTTSSAFTGAAAVPTVAAGNAAMLLGAAGIAMALL